jgi:6-phosphogluconolactonase
MNTRPQAADPLVFISAFNSPEGAIHAFHVRLETGQLEPAQRTTGIENPFFTVVSPNGRFLYAVHAHTFGGSNHEEIAAFEVVGRNGELRPLNRQTALGSAACYLDIDATGRTVLVANYSTGSVAALQVREDGSLGATASFSQHAGKGIDPGRQEGPHAHCIVVSPNNRFAYAADLGLDQVLSYRLDAAKAKLSPNRQPFVRTPPGAGPRHLTFHPNGRQLYVINELGNSVTLFDHDPRSGVLIERQTLSTLPAGCTDTSYCADVRITPDGQFLYGTNRGHNSIAAFRLDATGRMALIEIQPSLGKGPQNLAIVGGGELLLCANMAGNNVVVFRIDRQTGRLSPVGAPVAMPSPSCIRVLP